MRKLVLVPSEEFWRHGTLILFFCQSFLLFVRFSSNGKFESRLSPWVSSPF